MRTQPGTRTRTWTDSGWLYESPKNIWPQAWDLRGRSALRKCMFLPAPPRTANVRASAPLPAPKAARPETREERPIVTRRPDPSRHARMFAAVSPEDVSARRRAPDVTAAKLLRERWYEDPIVLGTLLILAPPMGLAALWSSRRYSSDARLALTIMTALVLCLGAAVTIALVAVRA